MLNQCYLTASSRKQQQNTCIKVCLHIHVLGFFLEGVSLKKKKNYPGRRCPPRRASSLLEKKTPLVKLHPTAFSWGKDLAWIHCKVSTITLTAPGLPPKFPSQILILPRLSQLAKQRQHFRLWSCPICRLWIRILLQLEINCGIRRWIIFSNHLIELEPQSVVN